MSRFQYLKLCLEVAVLTGACFVCRATPPKIGIHLISAEKEERSVIVQWGEVSAEKYSSARGGSFIPGTEKFFYGEIGAYDQYFEAVTQSGKKADLFVRLYFSPLTHKDVVEESLVWKARLQRKYEMLMNITVEDQGGGGPFLPQYHADFPLSL